jgi:hypothetical protein
MAACATITSSTSVNDIYHLIVITSNKMCTTSSQPEPNLRCLALLCNTLDRNMPLLEAVMSKPTFHDTEEGISFNYEHIALPENSGGPEIYQDLGHLQH